MKNTRFTEKQSTFMPQQAERGTAVEDITQTRWKMRVNTDTVSDLN